MWTWLGVGWGKLPEYYPGFSLYFSLSLLLSFFFLSFFGGRYHTGIARGSVCVWLTGYASYYALRAVLERTAGPAGEVDFAVWVEGVVACSPLEKEGGRVRG